MAFDPEEEVLNLIETNPLLQRFCVLALQIDLWFERGFVLGQIGWFGLNVSLRS
jgi:hypothetical protein